MSFYKYLFSAHYKEFFASLKLVAKKEKRCFLVLLIDSIILMLRFGFGMADYLNYELYKKGKKERREYISTKEEGLFYAKVSPAEYKKRFTVKPRFLKEFSDYTKREFLVPAEAKFEDFLAFLERNPVFMSKPYDGLAGQEVKKEYAKDIEDKRAYFENAVEKRYFFEELVRQHEGMNRLCPTSVNTLRIMTFNDHGKSRIFWMGLRVGNGINPVDNFHAKGMGAVIDMETGRLCGEAVDKSLNRFSEHPTTKVRFDGFEIPCFKEAKELVLKASLEDEHILVVGWDVAISEKGPLLIEGNRRPGFDLVQVVSRRGRRDVVEAVLKSLDMKL